MTGIEMLLRSSGVDMGKVQAGIGMVQKFASQLDVIESRLARIEELLLGHLERGLGEAD